MPDTQEALAFNRGADARIRGVPFMYNPYRGGDAEKRYRTAWAWGWTDCHATYGREVRGRWYYTPLIPLPK